jgi:lysophospholipase L1-like esterase
VLPPAAATSTSVQVELPASEHPAPVSSTPSPKQRRPKFGQTYLVAFMGDSLTDYRSGGGHFISVLSKHCPRSQFDNYGKGGEMTNQMRRRFERDVFGPKKPPYTHVVVFGGVNDLYSDITAHRTNEKIEGDLSTMYTMAHEAQVVVIALTVSPWGGFTRYYNKSRAEHTKKLNAWILQQRGGLVDDVIETSPLLSCGDPEKLCPAFQGGFKDGLHFGREGHEKLGEALFQQVFHDCR